MKKLFTKITKSFHTGEKGFTLIELLIVIVILGVLAAAIIPNLSKFTKSGNVGAANAELASVRTGIAAYQAENDSALPASPVKTGSDIEEFIQGTIKGEYLLDDDGNVGVGTTYPLAGVFWDDTNKKFTNTAPGP